LNRRATISFSRRPLLDPVNCSVEDSAFIMISYCGCEEYDVNIV
jgi:hypothetical protein